MIILSARVPKLNYFIKQHIQYFLGHQYGKLKILLLRASLVPVVLKQAREKSGCSTRLGPRCDVTAKGASERLADFSIFNMAEKFIYTNNLVNTTMFVDHVRCLHNQIQNCFKNVLN
jgi:hypothetical protein